MHFSHCIRMLTGGTPLSIGLFRDSKVTEIKYYSEHDEVLHFLRRIPITNLQTEDYEKLAKSMTPRESMRFHEILHQKASRICELGYLDPHQHADFILLNQWGAISERVQDLIEAGLHLADNFLMVF